jgi:hypothetical protein
VRRIRRLISLTSLPEAGTIRVSECPDETEVCTVDFQRFLGALWKRWWALLSSAALTLLGIYALATNRSNSWVLWSSFGAAVVMLLVASAWAWHDEHTHSLELEGEIEDLRRLPAQFEITPYEIRSSGTGRDIFLRAKVSLAGIIEQPEVTSVAGRWRLHDGTPSIPRSEPMPVNPCRRCQRVCAVATPQRDGFTLSQIEANMN